MNLLSSSVTPATKAIPDTALHMAHFIAHSLQFGPKGTLVEFQVAWINYRHIMMGYTNLMDNCNLKKELKSTKKVTSPGHNHKHITIKY